MKKETPAPAPLRVIHAVVFLGFASASIAGVHQELLQLWFCLTHRYTGGTLPAPLPCGGALLAGAMALAIVLCVLTGRSVPLAVSALLLAGFAMSLTAISLDPHGRTVPGSNVKCLDAANTLHGLLNGPLQKTGRVPTEPQKIEKPTPFHRGLFTDLDWHVALVTRTDALPDGAEPGWLLLEVPADRGSFIITSVGIDTDGEPSLLRQDGKPVEYRGAYNPDTLR